MYFLFFPDTEEILESSFESEVVYMFFSFDNFKLLDCLLLPLFSNSKFVLYFLFYVRSLSYDEDDDEEKSLRLFLGFIDFYAMIYNNF